MSAGVQQIASRPRRATPPPAEIVTPDELQILAAYRRARLAAEAIRRVDHCATVVLEIRITAAGRLEYVTPRVGEGGGW